MTFFICVPFDQKKNFENVLCNNPVMDDRNYQHIYKPTNDKEFEGHITMNMHGGHSNPPQTYSPYNPLMDRNTFV